MKCFIIALKDIFESEMFKKLLKLDNDIVEMNSEGKIVRFLIYEPKLIYKSFFELDKLRKENKLSGIIVLTSEYNIEKYIKYAKMFNYEIFVIRTKELLLPNNELYIEFKVKQINEVLNLISSL